jgi:hypothetical protein
MPRSRHDDEYEDEDYEEDEDEESEDEEEEGEDWVCAYCGRAARGSDDECPGCGSPRPAQPHHPHHEEPPPAAAPPQPAPAAAPAKPPAKDNGACCGCGCLALLLLILLGVCFGGGSKSDRGAKGASGAKASSAAEDSFRKVMVYQKTWTRYVHVESRLNPGAPWLEDSTIKAVSHGDAPPPWPKVRGRGNRAGDREEEQMVSLRDYSDFYHKTVTRDEYRRLHAGDSIRVVVRDGAVAHWILPPARPDAPAGGAGRTDAHPGGRRRGR